MRRLRSIPKKFLLAALLSVFVAGGLFAAWRWGFRKPPADRYQSLRNWQAISGRWSERSSVISNSKPVQKSRSLLVSLTGFSWIHPHSDASTNGFIPMVLWIHPQSIHSTT